MVIETAESVDRGTHNCVIAPHLKNELDDFSESKYGRMFPHLRTPDAGEDLLLALGRSGAAMADLLRMASA